MVLPPKTKIHTCNADYIIKREIALTKTDQLAVQYTSSVTRSHDRFWIFGFFTLAMKFLVVEQQGLPHNFPVVRSKTSKGKGTAAFTSICHFFF